MSAPSAFDIGRQVGTNFANVRKTAKDESVIENILSQAMQSGNPEAIQNSIGQILSQVSPERQGAAIQYLQGTYNDLKKKQEQDQQFQREKDAGLVPGINPTAQSAIYKEGQKSQRISNAGNVFNDITGVNAAPGMQQQNVPQAGAQEGSGQPTAPQIQPQSTLPASNEQKKKQLLALTGHPDREVSERAKAELKEIENKEKLLQEDRKLNRKEIIEFHKETQKFDEDLIKNTRIAKNQIDTINGLEKNIKSGNIKPNSWANIFKGFGKIGDKLSEALINQDEAGLQAAIPQLLEGWKDVFGVRLTDADLRLLQDKLPSIGKSPEANLAITRMLKKYAEMTLLRSQIAADIKKNNEGLRPLGYANKIEERFDEMIQPIKIIRPAKDSQPEREIEIPAYKLSEALKAGARLANE